MTSICHEFKRMERFCHKGQEFFAMHQHGNAGNVYIYSNDTADTPCMRFWGAWSTVDRFKKRRESDKENAQFGELTYCH